MKGKLTNVFGKVKERIYNSVPVGAAENLNKVAAWNAEDVEVQGETCESPSLKTVQ